MPRSKSVFNAFALTTFICFTTPVIAAGDLTLMELQPGMTKILKIDRPFQVMVIGNPNVAKASVVNQNSIAITGQGTGLTNLVIFDSEGSEIITTRIQVVQAAYFSEHAVPRREVRVIVFDTKGRNPDRDRRYLCGQNCSEIAVDRPEPVNPPGYTSQAVGTTTSKVINYSAPPVPGQAPAMPSGQY